MYIVSRTGSFDKEYGKRQGKSFIIIPKTGSQTTCYMYCVLLSGLRSFLIFLFFYFNTKIECMFGNLEQTDGSYKCEQGNLHTSLQNLNHQRNGQERQYYGMI